MGRKKVNFGKGKRSSKLVGKNGQYNTQNKKNVDKLETAINARTDLTNEDKTDYINKLRADIKAARNNQQSLTENGYWSRQLKIDTVERLAIDDGDLTKRKGELKNLKAFSNAGVDVDELARELGVNRGQLLDPANWHTDKTTGETKITINGQTYTYKFTYSGSSLKKEK